MKHILLVVTISFAATFTCLSAEKIPADKLGKLEAYSVVIDSMSKTGSMESMPLGNGDISLNAWVDKGGDLMFYIGKSDSWSEALRLLKIGRVRVSFSPNPFADPDCRFKEELVLSDGTLKISADSRNGKFDIKLYVDAKRPLIHIEAKADCDFTMTVKNDGMRKEKVSAEGESFKGIANSPEKIYESADIVISDKDLVAWAHRDETSPYNMMLKLQGCEGMIGKYDDPILRRTFGAGIFGSSLKIADKYTAVSKVPAKSCEADIVVLTNQAKSLDSWIASLKYYAGSVAHLEAADTYREHIDWWREFWGRSWIFISGDEDARILTRAWLLQRYMVACQGRGAYPVKFNGGSLTFDYDDHDGDYRKWGHGYWNQNERLLYWPLLASGDYDMMMPWFDMYLNALPFQRDVTNLQYGHDGAYFPETMNFFGLFTQDDWGWNNKNNYSDNTWIRHHFTGSLEVLTMMLDYYDYTQDSDFAKQYIVPMAIYGIRFFDEHWKRGDDDKIYFFPAHSLEQYWECTNPTPYIAALKYNIDRLKKLPSSIITQEMIAEWDYTYDALPDIPSKDSRVLPAGEYDKGMNFENPELYTVFPFRMYGIGQGNEKEIMATYDGRVFNDCHSCWSQDGIQAALLGLADDAAKFTLKKAMAKDADVRFPAFWTPGSDYIPDLDNGGSMAMALQYMLLNCDFQGDAKVLPAWPGKWKVDFRLKAKGGKTIDFEN